jgi:hypothetical protein
MEGPADYSLPAIFVMSIGALFDASEIGHHLGLRVAGQANLSTLDAAMLGLLALIISFAFAMALSRYDGRRAALLREANAIGTTALRARLLPTPCGASIATCGSHTSMSCEP